MRTNGDWMTPVLPPAKSFGNILRLGNGRGQFLDSLDTPEAIITGRGLLDNGEPRCIAFGGLRVDDAIEEALLGVVEPGAIAAAVEADRNMASQRDQGCPSARPRGGALCRRPGITTIRRG
ncbi:hypothetical protein [Sinorhizobium medicae]|uniref:hypothetical protein n=1 Tax=Sinorhizobium medicae TaxID=110321 RepID=UPI001F35E876|nr:hypothetical protein [Sinorhizobium medicae]